MTATMTHTGEFVLLDRSGDKNKSTDPSYAWDKSNPEQVTMARRIFDEHVKDRKHLAYKVTGSGSKSKREVIREFDPTAEKIVFAPQNVGG